MRQHWKLPGDRVEKDEIVCEIQTDVAQLQIPAPASGILEEWIYEPHEFIYAGGKSGEQVIGKIKRAEQAVATIQLHPSRSKGESELAVAGDLVDIVMPSFPSMWDPAMRQHWKLPGDRVKKDEIVCEIQTDVAQVQIPAPASGILEEWIYEPHEFIYAGGKSGEQVIGKIKRAEQEVAAVQP